MEPIERTEPLEQIDSSEPSDQSDQRDPEPFEPAHFEPEPFEPEPFELVIFPIMGHGSGPEERGRSGRIVVHGLEVAPSCRVVLSTPFCLNAAKVPVVVLISLERAEPGRGEYAPQRLGLVPAHLQQQGAVGVQ